MDVGTLPNHVKSGVFWLYGGCNFNCLLVVNHLRFGFRYGVFNLVFLYCLVGDRSSTIDIKAMTGKTTITIKFEVEKYDGKSNFLLWKMRVTSVLVKRGTHKAGLVLRRSRRRWMMMSEMTSTFTQRRESYCTYQTRFSTTSCTRRQLLVFGIGCRAFI